MVDDHTALNKGMASVADSLGVLLPKKMPKDDQAEYDRLNGLSGKDFDTEYLTYIVKAHRQDLHAFYMEASLAADPTLQTEVLKGMFTMHQHLGMISRRPRTRESLCRHVRRARCKRPRRNSAQAGKSHKRYEEGLRGC